MAGVIIDLTACQSLEDVEAAVPDGALADYTYMTDVKLRSSMEVERGLYMAESHNVIMRALETGHHPRSFLMAPRWLEQMEHLLASSRGSVDGGDVPVYIASEEVLEHITGFHLHRGALAAMQRPELPDVSDLLARSRRIAVLEDLVDHTNVGAIFRSAAALGVDAVIVTPRCCDPLYRRSVRVSMGTVFQVPWTRLGTWPGVDVLREAGYCTVACALSDDSLSLDEFVANPPDKKVALLFGTEGDGLSRRTIEQTDLTVRIPMAGGVDSLNVAAASAVFFWATRALN